MAPFMIIIFFSMTHYAKSLIEQITRQMLVFWQVVWQSVADEVVVCGICHLESTILVPVR
jgi:hypothetical protein